MKRRAKLLNPFKRVKVLKGRSPRKKKRKFQALLIYLLLITFGLLIFRFIEAQMLSTVMDVSDMKIKTVANDIIGIAIDETIEENQIDTQSLITYYYNDQNEMISFGVNTILINQISSGVMAKIVTVINNYDDETLFIPIGRLTGSGLFSNVGPRIKVHILPFGTVSTSYDSSFIATGINQINHKIWLEIELTMKVIAPLSAKEVKVKQNIVLIDRVISGEVPNQYINVPGDQFLNVVD